MLFHVTSGLSLTHTHTLTLTLKLMECDVLSQNKLQQENKKKNQTDGLVDHRFNEKKRPEQKMSALNLWLKSWSWLITSKVHFQFTANQPRPPLCPAAERSPRHSNSKTCNHWVRARAHVDDRSLPLLPVLPSGCCLSGSARWSTNQIRWPQRQSDGCQVIVKYQRFLSVINAKIFDLPFKKIVPIFPQVFFFLQNIQALLCTAKKIRFC